MEHTVKIIRLPTQSAILVWVDEKAITPAASFNHRYHSPDGFEAGYGGSGPAQLALAILLQATSVEFALNYYQRFKWHFIAKSEYQEAGEYEFTFTAEEVRELP